MKTRAILPLLMGLLLTNAAYGAEAATASSMIDSAVASAKAEHKGVLVIYHASWCGWCKRLDKTLEVPALKAVLDKDFVVLHVTVLENDAHKSDENPGGAELMLKMGGKDAGLPFYAMLDSAGKVVADSKVVATPKAKPMNMGFPTEPVEIDHFVAMLKAGNPTITADEAASIRKVLVARAAEIKSASGH